MPRSEQALSSSEEGEGEADEGSDSLLHVDSCTLHSWTLFLFILKQPYEVHSKGLVHWAVYLKFKTRPANTRATNLDTRQLWRTRGPCRSLDSTQDSYAPVISTHLMHRTQPTGALQGSQFALHHEGQQNKEKGSALLETYHMPL